HHPNPVLTPFPTRRSSDLQMLQTSLSGVRGLGCSDWIRHVTDEGNSFAPGGSCNGEVQIFRQRRIDLDEIHAGGLELRYRLSCLDRKSTRLNSSHSQISYA